MKKKNVALTGVGLLMAAIVAFAASIPERQRYGYLLFSNCEAMLRATLGDVNLVDAKSVPFMKASPADEARIKARNGEFQKYIKSIYTPWAHIEYRHGKSGVKRNAFCRYDATSFGSTSVSVKMRYFVSDDTPLPIELIPGKLDSVSYIFGYTAAVIGKVCGLVRVIDADSAPI